MSPINELNLSETEEALQIVKLPSTCQLPSGTGLGQYYHNLQDHPGDQSCQEGLDVAAQRLR
jgi:hypothetical protein